MTSEDTLRERVAAAEAALAEAQQARAREGRPPLTRLPGREVILTIIRDGKPVEMRPVLDFEVEVQRELSNEEYFGEARERFADVFKGAQLVVEGKTQGDRAAWEKFCTNIIGRGTCPNLGPTPKWLSDMNRAMTTRVERTHSGHYVVKAGGRPRARYRTKALADRAAGVRRSTTISFVLQRMPVPKSINLRFRLGSQELEAE